MIVYSHSHTDTFNLKYCSKWSIYFKHYYNKEIKIIIQKYYKLCFSKTMLAH